MKNTLPKSFRLSREAADAMKACADRAGLSDTEVVEICIAKYAMELGVEVERAKAMLLAIITKGKRGGSDK